MSSLTEQPASFLGHAQDRDLRALQRLEQSIEAQLELEHQLTERDQREIALAQCFPHGRLVLRGRLSGYFPTLDPEVVRSYLIQDGRRKGILYINLLRRVCVAVDWSV